ncbi:MAG: galactose mutarotase [Erysipelotrichaceae bacterium]|nr:galactose mutarotase [Erysipelotrichaceae bacterium]
MISIAKDAQTNCDVISLKNDNIELVVTDYGATILKVIVKDKNGQSCDVVLGFESLDDYRAKGGTYLNAIVGRVANRIGKGTFVLNGQRYHVPVNNGPNSLHGGIDGFSYKLWDYETSDKQVTFHYHAQDGEEGYPGNLDVDVTYQLLDDGYKIIYHATGDQDTIVNMTNHAYFNLNGHPSSIYNHEMTVHASHIGCVDEDGLFTGTILDVTDTPFDFRQSKAIGDMITKPHIQLELGNGYDHSFLFDRTNQQIELYSPESGVVMTVSTTLPLAQIYTGNYLNNEKSKDGSLLKPRDGICFETQYLPDSINKETDSPVILRAGDSYDEETSFTFKVK